MYSNYWQNYCCSLSRRNSLHAHISQFPIHSGPKKFIIIYLFLLTIVLPQNKNCTVLCTDAILTKYNYIANTLGYTVM